MITFEKNHVFIGGDTVFSNDRSSNSWFWHYFPGKHPNRILFHILKVNDLDENGHNY